MSGEGKASDCPIVGIERHACTLHGTAAQSALHWSSVPCETGWLHLCGDSFDKAGSILSYKGVPQLVLQCIVSNPTFSVVLLPHIILKFFRHLLAMAESAGTMYALATVLSVLAIVAVILRFYARRVKQTALSWDDYAILPALVRHFPNTAHLLSQWKS